MSRFGKFPRLADLVTKVTHSTHTGYLSLCLALVLSLAVLWPKFFFIVGAGIIGAAVGFWRHYGQYAENPVQILRPTFGVSRKWTIGLISLFFMVLSITFFLSGLFAPEENHFISVLYLTFANGCFSFSIAYFTAGSIAISDAKERLSAATVAQARTWQQEIEASSSIGILSDLFHKA